MNADGSNASRQSPMQSVKIVEAATRHTGTVIFLHGLGDTGASFVPLARALQKKHPHVRFVFPTAKPKPISINNGYLMPAWYDVENMNRDRLADSIEDDEESMMNSVAVVDSLIEKEVTEQGINEDRIVIGGFSQGCVVTTLSSLILKRKIAGLIALSGWLALSHKIEELISPTAKDLAVFWGHGKQDRVIEHRYGRQSCFLLRTLEKVKLPLVPSGTPFAKPGLRFETYEGMDHSLNDQEIRDISEWLGQALPA